MLEKDLKAMVETLMEKLKEIEEICYDNYDNNVLVFELSVYLFMRYGEIPSELNDNELLKKVSHILKKQDTLFDLGINELVEDLMQDNEEENEEE